MEILILFGIIFVGGIMELLKKAIASKAKVCENHVLRVDSFLNQFVDIDLVNQMALEWKRLYKNSKITKILTIESSGIALATAAGFAFGVPVVFAKKEYTTRIPDNSLAAKIYSYTMKKSYYAYVPEEYINEDDVVLIIDDVIANGWTAEGLIDIVCQASATLEGLGVAIEKTYQSGGARLRTKGIRVESLAKIKDLDQENCKVIFDE